MERSEWIATRSSAIISISISDDNPGLSSLDDDEEEKEDSAFRQRFAASINLGAFSSISSSGSGMEDSAAARVATEKDAEATASIIAGTF